MLKAYKNNIEKLCKAEIITKSVDKLEKMDNNINTLIKRFIKEYMNGGN